MLCRLPISETNDECWLSIPFLTTADIYNVQSTYTRYLLYNAHSYSTVYSVQGTWNILYEISIRNVTKKHVMNIPVTYAYFYI